MSSKQQADIVIIGAGIAGISAACFLSRTNPAARILLIDRNQPMSYTTSKSGENFRTYWPQRCMEQLAARSIELMESFADSGGGHFELRRFGYDFVSQRDTGNIFSSRHLERKTGAQSLKLIDDLNTLRRQFPYLSSSTKRILRNTQAGAVDVYGLGTTMLRRATQNGVELIRAEVNDIVQQEHGFTLSNDAGNSVISCKQLVLAAGPMLPNLAAKLGLQLPVQSFLQRKFVIPDPNSIIPRDMPFTIFSDSQALPWSNEEREAINADEQFHWLLEEFPPGLHIKPEGKEHIKLGWAFNRSASEPVWDPSDDDAFVDITLRGASTMIPELARYLDTVPTPVFQFSGYYTRTPENWPLIGPAEDIPGLFLIGALSGFGTMMACAAGELLSQWMTGDPLPQYASYFSPQRYRDDSIKSAIDASRSDGQL